jgi:hypothetical protein
VDADDAAARMEEGRKILLAELIDTLLEQTTGLTQSKAERLARTSTAYRDATEQMHATRHQANQLRVDMQDKDRVYWQIVAAEATNRVERRMG